MAEYQINPSTGQVEQTSPGKGYTGKVFSSFSEAQSSLNQGTGVSRSISPSPNEVGAPTVTPGRSLLDNITAPTFSPFGLEGKEDREAKRLAAQKQGIELGAEEDIGTRRDKLERDLGTGEAYFGKTVGLGASNVAFGILQGMKAEAENDIRKIQRDKQTALLNADTASFDRLDALEQKALDRQDSINQRIFENQLNIVDKQLAERADIRGEKQLEYALGSEERQIAGELRALQAKYPDANILEDDTFDVAIAKMKSSATFQREEKDGMLREVGGGLYRINDDGSIDTLIAPRVGGGQLPASATVGDFAAGIMLGQISTTAVPSAQRSLVLNRTNAMLAELKAIQQLEGNQLSTTSRRAVIGDLLESEEFADLGEALVSAIIDRYFPPTSFLSFGAGTQPKGF